MEWASNALVGYWQVSGVSFLMNIYLYKCVCVLGTFWRSQMKQVFKTMWDGRGSHGVKYLLYKLGWLRKTMLICHYKSKIIFSFETDRWESKQRLISSQVLFGITNTATLLDFHKIKILKLDLLPLHFITWCDLLIWLFQNELQLIIFKYFGTTIYF